MLRVRGGENQRSSLTHFSGYSETAHCTGKRGHTSTLYKEGGGSQPRATAHTTPSTKQQHTAPARIQFTTSEHQGRNVYITSMALDYLAIVTAPQLFTWRRLNPHYKGVTPYRMKRLASNCGHKHDDQI